ncbi:MAG: nitroreductase family protein, partial [candidate division Zixibacteria bacterium]|nr:nitroreductase family protein [candidate division Zixibacteria bacterium]
ATSRKLADLCRQKFIGEAPVNLLFCIDWRRIHRWAKIDCAPYSANHAFRHFWISFQDTIIAAQNICTAADAHGLGSVYIGTVMDLIPQMVDMFTLPREVMPVVLLCLGYPEGSPLPRRKLGPDVVVHHETYQDLSDDVLRDAFSAKYPDWQKAVDDRRLESIQEVCTTVHGPEFADQCLARIREQGYINMVQNYFGLHYVADGMPQNNEDFVKLIVDRGFTWFTKTEFPIARAD